MNVSNTMAARQVLDIIAAAEQGRNVSQLQEVVKGVVAWVGTKENPNASDADRKEMSARLKQTKLLLREAMGQVMGGPSTSSNEPPSARPGSALFSVPAAAPAAGPLRPGGQAGPAAAAAAPAVVPPPGMPFLPGAAAGRGRGRGAYNPLGAGAGGVAARPAYNPLAAMQQAAPMAAQQSIPGYAPPRPPVAAMAAASAGRGPGALPAMPAPGGRGWSGAPGRGGYRPPGMAYQPMQPGYPPQQAAVPPPPGYGMPQYAAWLRQQQAAAAARQARLPPVTPLPPAAGAVSAVKWEAPAMPQAFDSRSDLQAGLSASASTSSFGGVEGGQEEQDENECIVCMAAEKNALCLPCGHKNMCSGCARDYVKRSHTECPVCRTKLEAIYLIDETTTLAMPAA